MLKAAKLLKEGATAFSPSCTEGVASVVCEGQHRKGNAIEIGTQVLRWPDIYGRLAACVLELVVDCSQGRTVNGQ